MDFIAAIPELTGAGVILAGAFKAASSLWDFLSVRVKHRMNKDDHEYDLDKSAIEERRATITLATQLASTFISHEKALDAITERLTQTNPALYGQFKVDIIEAVQAVPAEVGKLLPPQLDALKASVEASISSMSEQLLSRLDQQDEQAQITRLKVRAETDAALQRITDELDNLTAMIAKVMAIIDKDTPHDPAS